jgi:histidinol-phosphatase (PHP family)
MLATYHIHSRYSDGLSGIPELIEQALALGVAELGISDHFVLPPHGRLVSWAMRPDRLGEYVTEVTHLQHQLQQDRAPLVLRLGLEVDYFPGHAPAIADALAGVPWDYLIGSVHEVDGFGVDSRAEDWAALSPAERQRVHRRYWQILREMADSRMFDIAAHLDLTRKFAFYPTEPLDREIAAALDAIAAAGMVVELNTAGWHKPCNDAYPSLAILQQCHQRGIAATLSSDAHEPAHLLRDFDRGAAVLAQAGYTEFVRFAGRDRILARAAQVK